ncbi:MAG: hypothetical protein B6D61_08160 [Bacteroidetes bacterium 4484_249]|nr:MAG: hypothetical protein B6D61_08160 [Bacteroidetes bacterium 4484_249]
MFRIIKTIQKIFENKQLNESNEYLKGFKDCLELIIIGYKKSGSVNLHWENSRLKLILFKLLDFKNVLIGKHLIKIDELALLYDSEYIFIDKLYTYIADLSNNPNKENLDRLEVKMQNFMLKEIIFKLIYHKFNLTKNQKKTIGDIVATNKTENQKILDIASYINKIEIDNSWPDYHEMETTIKNLYAENNLYNKIIRLFLKTELSKFDKYEISDIFKSNIATNNKLRSILFYLGKIRFSTSFEYFRLSQANKMEIKSILRSTQVTDQSLNELFNYINFIVSNDERKTLKKITKKNRNR